jgi:phosphohistidine phosphatase
MRTRQTAQALGVRLRIVDELAPGATVADILGAVRWGSRRGTVVVVGHQPSLGLVAASLISGTPAPWSIKKGAVWWLRHTDTGEPSGCVLRAVMSPDMV